MILDSKNKKFLFDLHNFDEDESMKDKEEKNTVPPPPTFSMEDMETARRQSFEQGKEEGIRVTKESIEQRVELLIQSLDQNFTALDAQEEIRNKKFVDDSVSVIYKALQVCLPALLAGAAAESEIKAALTAFFATSGNSSMQYRVFVNPAMCDNVTHYAKKLHANLSIEADENLSISESRIEWASGKAEWFPDKIAACILEIISPFIKERLEILDDSTKKPHNGSVIQNGNAEEAVPSHQDGGSQGNG